VLQAQLGQFFGEQPIDTQTALLILVDLFDLLGQFRVFFSRSEWFRFSQA
jgi:hypothetical protein